MQNFVYEGRTYQFDANACYSGSGLIGLPDGTVLQVGGWFESLPPQPGGLRPVTVTPATEPAAPPS